MIYLNYKDIRVLNIEHTSKCNLLCPQCARTINGKLNPNLPLKEISISDYNRILSDEFLDQLEHVFFCGNYGDVIASSNITELVHRLKLHAVNTTVYTNGSLRSPDWWNHFAQILYGKVIFAIDGLEDTNSIYRVNSNFNKVIENSIAFIAAGGKARWDYLIFEHNYHQVEEAKRLAKQIGFQSFNEKLTSRFIDNTHYQENLKNKSANLKKKTTFSNVIDKYGSWENYINKTKITCKYQTNKIMYIDFDLNLWPCCWVGAPLFFYGDDNIQKNQIIKLYDRYGSGFNSLKEKSIRQVLEHKWFKTDLVTSWNNKMNSENFKLMTCGRTCGMDYHFSSGDENNKKETVL